MGLGQGLKWRSHNKNGQESRGVNKGVKHAKQRWQFGYVAYKNKECLYHVILMHMLNVISKKIKASAKYVIMEKTHMKET